MLKFTHSTHICDEMMMIIWNVLNINVFFVILWLSTKLCVCNDGNKCKSYSTLWTINICLNWNRSVIIWAFFFIVTLDGSQMMMNFIIYRMLFVMRYWLISFSHILREYTMSYYYKLFSPQGQKYISQMCFWMFDYLF